MSEESSVNNPFKPLGDHLKQIRQRLQESLVEVSGAVEIEVDTLSSIEQGITRPSEDILLLLVSHFGTKDDEAAKLWELAGYDQTAVPPSNILNDAGGNASHAVVVLPVDMRVSYTDNFQITVNNYGVVMNFIQTTGNNNQSLAVARLGMSKEHAKSVVEVLQKALSESEMQHTPKALPAPKSKSKPDNKPKA